jgi:hypothetical protein
MARSKKGKNLAKIGALLAILFLSAISVAQDQASWFGTWRLNPAKSTGLANSPYKRVTQKIAPSPNGLSVIFEMVGVRGGVAHVEWNGSFDGKDYPVQGVDYVMTNAYSRIDDRNYSIVTKHDGQTTSTVKVTVSPDGRTLTAVTTGANGSTTAVYDRM